MATEEDLAKIDAKIKEKIKESVEFAENSPFPSSEDAYTDVYADPSYPFIQN